MTRPPQYWHHNHEKKYFCSRIQARAIYDYTFGPGGSFVNLQLGGWVAFNVTHTITQNTSNTATAYGFDQYKNLATDTDSAFVEVYYPTAGISLTKTPSASAR